MVLNPISPATQKVNLNLKYHGLSGTYVGTALTLQGIDIVLVFTPKKLPIIVNGEAQHNHKTNKDKISKKFTAAEDFSKTKIIFTIEYPRNTIPGNIIAVMMEAFNHCFPLRSL